MSSVLNVIQYLAVMVLNISVCYASCYQKLLQWNLDIKRLDITKPSDNKVILLVLIFLCFFTLI